jgi:DNA-binding transcriptional ArsR family regulator
MLAEAPVDDRALVRALKALADPTRFRMVQEIAAAGELSCGQIAEHFDVSQPTISHHLKILSDADILLRRSEGKHHFTSVNEVLLKQLVTLLPARLSPSAKREPRKKSPMKVTEGR